MPNKLAIAILESLAKCETPISARQLVAAVRKDSKLSVTKAVINPLLYQASIAGTVKLIPGNPPKWMIPKQSVISCPLRAGSRLDLDLPKTLTHGSLLKLLGQNGVLISPRCNIRFNAPRDFFAIPSGISLLCAWILDQQRKAGVIEIRGEKESMSYLARMNFFKVLNLPFDEDFDRHPAAGRFIPLQFVEGESGWNVVRQIGNLILHQFDNARDFFPAVEWAVNEVVDNIIIHSETKSPGIVSAQYYPDNHQIQIGICDMGRGIWKSLNERYTLRSHADAITAALERGITRNPDIGQGNGLAGTLAIAKANGGSFQLWSGDACFKLTPKGVSEIVPIQCGIGTGIYLCLNTQRPVNLGDTFIGSFIFGDNCSTYIYSESERVTSGDGLSVKKECNHTGSRPPATALRRKINGILPDIDKDPVILNFADIESASSSFLDELLARLVIQCGGIAQFKSKIKVTNMNETLEKMANVVIKQRLDLEITKD